MSTLSLHDLPSELLESILVVQPPSTVCAASCVSRALRAAATSPAVWHANTLRTLRVEAATAHEARALANTLVCAWWAASGALVRGVPVHFRRGFVAVRQRGAANLVRIRTASEDAALVLGASDDWHGASAHAPKPSLEMDFALNEKGPFPEDGMVLRVTGAPVPSTPPSPPSSPLARSPSARGAFPWASLGRSPPSSPRSGPRLPRASQLRAEGARQRDIMMSTSVEEEVNATVRVVLNGTEVGRHTVNEQCAFKHVDLDIPASLLRCKPKMNMISVEYVEADSNASYWLKGVRVVPKILPLGAPKAIENIPLRHVGCHSHGGEHSHKAEHGIAHKPLRGTAAAFSLDRIMGC